MYHVRTHYTNVKLIKRKEKLRDVAVQKQLVSCI